MGDTWIPSLGAIVQPFAWLRFKANIERSYRTPSFEELYLPDKGFIQGNPDLEAEEALGIGAEVEILTNLLKKDQKSNLKCLKQNKNSV